MTCRFLVSGHHRLRLKSTHPPTPFPVGRGLLVLMQQNTPRRGAVCFAAGTIFIDYVVNVVPYWDWRPENTPWRLGTGRPWYLLCSVRTLRSAGGPSALLGGRNVVVLLGYLIVKRRTLSMLLLRPWATME